MARWFRTAKNQEVRTRPLACPFAHTALRAKNCAYGGFIDICFSFGLHGAHKLEETRLGDLGQFFAICPPLLHSCSPPLHIEKIIDKF